MKLLKITTAGSVDDGKSTLIGRLLYDTHSVPDDKKEEIFNTSIRRGGEEIDYSLFTDGLIAEREQGITIDVAHIYFSTPKRKFIIADTPGHIEYTRNMITGASNSDVAIILIDARNGILEQTKRHLFIVNLLQLKHIFVAVNKMDLIEFNQQKYDAIATEFKQSAKEFGIAEDKLTIIPISAKKGDNITHISENTPWYKGISLLQALENFQLEETAIEEDTLFNIQYVIRPKGDKWIDFRGYAGKVNAGTLSVGDEISTYPSKKTAKIKEIIYNQQAVEKAVKGQSICVTLDNDIDLSRGEWIVNTSTLNNERTEVNATVCWLNEVVDAQVGSKFILQYGTTRTMVKLAAIESELQLENLQFVKSEGILSLNSIATTQWKTAQPVILSNSSNSHVIKNFILIDEQTNNTVGVGIMNNN
jgi:sulfate adenylyltransferase subunit 1